MENVVENFPWPAFGWLPNEVWDRTRLEFGGESEHYSVRFYYAALVKLNAFPQRFLDEYFC